MLFHNYKYLVSLTIRQPFEIQTDQNVAPYSCYFRFTFVHCGKLDKLKYFYLFFKSNIYIPNFLTVCYIKHIRAEGRWQRRDEIIKVQHVHSSCSFNQAFNRFTRFMENTRDEAQSLNRRICHMREKRACKWYVEVREH